MTKELWEFVELAPLGFLIGAYGTPVGVGGGALLVPALLLLMPGGGCNRRPNARICRSILQGRSKAQTLPGR